MKVSASYLQAFLFLISTIHAQPNIAWETLPGYENLPQCLQYIFTSIIYYSDTPQRWIGCETNDCMCQAHRIADNVPRVYTHASKECSNTEDAKSATSILDQYCSLNGYTSRVEAGEMTTPQGACTATVTVTETVTELMERSGNDARARGDRPSQSVLRRLIGMLLTGVVGFL